MDRRKTNSDTETGSLSKERNPRGKVKEVEAVLFIPSTPDSELRKRIQKAEDVAAKMMNTPTIRVVERAGTKTMEDVGDNNPWKKEWSCPRIDCLLAKANPYSGQKRKKRL